MLGGRVPSTLCCYNLCSTILNFVAVCLLENIVLETTELCLERQKIHWVCYSLCFCDHLSSFILGSYVVGSCVACWVCYSMDHFILDSSVV